MSKKIFITLFIIICIGIIYLSVNSVLSNKKVDAAWYSTGGTWTNRKSIVVDHSKVSGTTTLTNFPMLVSVIDPDLKHTSHGGKVGKTDGTDILFTSSDGSTKLDHEIEKYASTTGELIAWVKIPSLSPTTTTSTYIYFGNSGASDQQNVSGVWDASYLGVYHLKDGTTLSGIDSKGNSNGTITGAVATAGQIDGAAAFNGSDYIQTNQTITSAVTLSAWINTNDIYSRKMIYDKDASSEGQWWFETTRTNVGNVVFAIGSNIAGYAISETTTNTITANAWYYVTATWDKSSESGILRIYVNGTEASYYSQNSKTTDAPTSVSEPAYIGRNVRYGVYGDWDGELDEVRISNTKRSADWIKTEYNNQYSPSTFYSYEGLNVEQKNVSNSKLMNKVKVRGGVKFR